MTIRLLGIAGSLRAGSYNRKLLEVAYGLMPAGVEAASWDRLGELPAFNEDDEIRPMASVRALSSRCSVGQTFWGVARSLLFQS